MLFLVKSGAKIVKQVREISGTLDDIKICAYWYVKLKKSCDDFSSVLENLRAAVLVIGK